MNNIIAENIEQICDYFNIKLSMAGKCYIGKCPIHKGDNPTAFNFYHTRGHSTIGNWVCNTHECHNIFGNNSLGLIRALLSVKNGWGKEGDSQKSFAEAVKWCEKHLGIKYKSGNRTRDISNVINRLYVKENLKYKINLSNSQYLNSGLVFPDKYFLSRGYQPKTIKEFAIGFCANPVKPMYNRAIVPLHDNEGKKIIGCSGRIVYAKCDICQSYHDTKKICPNKDFKNLYPKWKHSSSFPGKYSLYNWHRAIKYIQKSGLAILTEGQPNVWRLFEAGFPMSLSCFGSNLAIEQKRVLDTSGAHTIIIVPDADKASEKFTKKIIELCKHSYNIVTIEPSYDDDIGECNIETVKTILSPFVEKYRYE